MSDRHAENGSLSTARALTARVADAVETVANPVTEREREYRCIVTLYAPFTALVLVARLYLLSGVVRISISTAQYRSVGFSLDVYAMLFGDPYYHWVAFDSLRLTTGTTLVSVGLAVPIAHALEKYNLPGEDLFVTLVSFPINLPGIVAAFMILVLSGNNDIVTAVTATLTGGRPTDLVFAVSVPGLFIAFVYSMVSRTAFILHGTYAEVDSAAEETVQTLGMTPFETFRYVALPRIQPGITDTLILTFRTGLAIFGALIVIQIFVVRTLQLSRELDVGYDVQAADVMATVYFAFTFLSAALGLRYTSAEVGV